MTLRSDSEERTPHVGRMNSPLPISLLRIQRSLRHFTWQPHAVLVQGAPIPVDCLQRPPEQLEYVQELLSLSWVWSREIRIIHNLGEDRDRVYMRYRVAYRMGFRVSGFIDIYIYRV